MKEALTLNHQVPDAIQNLAAQLMAKDPKLDAEKAIIAARAIFFKKNR